MQPDGADLCTEPFEQSEFFCKVIPDRRTDDIREGKRPLITDSNVPEWALNVPICT